MVRPPLLLPPLAKGTGEGLHRQTEIARQLLFRPEAQGPRPTGVQPQHQGWVGAETPLSRLPDLPDVRDEDVKKQQDAGAETHRR